MTKHPYSRWCGCQDCLFAPAKSEQEPDEDIYQPEEPDQGPQTLADLKKTQGLVDDGYLEDLEYERRKDMRLFGDES